MADPVPALIQQFVAWVAERPRTYGDTMDAWRTSCPRLSIWEDAVRAGLVELAAPTGRPMRERAVVVTARGRALLVSAAAESVPPRVLEPAI